MPSVSKGDSGKVANIKVKEGKTQPPKRYTEGQLITLMKTAGKHLDNEELEKSTDENRGSREPKQLGLASLPCSKTVNTSM
ncbi:DNA topoisomerase [Peribacillus frigoritolerans]|nr:DNA topoisomerase [Peribacillus frigoritolerans]